MSKSHAVLVLGMHRSGTSAATGALVVRGAWPGEQLLPPSQGNPRGYWEHQGVHAIHEDLLHALGHAWDDLRPLPEGWLHQEAATHARHQLRRLIADELILHPVWTVKDPRLCRLLPLWLPLLDEMGVSASAVIVVRNPHEVAASLLTRSEWPLELSRELWWQHLSQAIVDSCALPRYVLAYPRLLADPVAEIEAVVNALQLNLAPAEPEVIEKLRHFVSADIRHHQADNRNMPGWESAMSLYQQLLAQPVSWSGISATLDAGRLAAQSLGPVVGEYARLYTAQRNKLHATGNQLTKTHHELEHARGELGTVRDDLNRTHAELEHTRGELGYIRSELNQTRAELNQTRSELDATRRQLQSSEQTLQKIMISHSWRLTRPLRWLGKWRFIFRK